RAPVCGTGGRWFEPTQLYQPFNSLRRTDRIVWRPFAMRAWVGRTGTKVENRGGQENRYWWWLLIVGVHRYTGTTFYRPVTPSPRCSQAAPHRRYFARSHCTPSRRSCPMSTKVTTLDLRRFRSCGHRARQGGPVQRRFTGAALGGPPLPRMLCRNSQFGHGCLYDRNGQNFLARKGRQVGTAAPSC